MKNILFLFFVSVISAGSASGQTKYEELALIDITLKCTDVNPGQLCVDFWSENPVEKFKSHNPFYAKLSADSLVKCWNIFVINDPSSRFHKMFEDGSTLCKKKNENGYVVTTATAVNGKVFLWAVPSRFIIGSKTEILFDCTNRVVLK